MSGPVKYITIVFDPYCDGHSYDEKDLVNTLDEAKEKAISLINDHDTPTEDVKILQVTGIFSLKLDYKVTEDKL